jgi:outer membrane lipoprotein
LAFYEFIMIARRKKCTMVPLVALAALLWAGGCAPPFSQAALDQVDRSVTFTELRSDPDRYKGKWVMLAGVIVATRNTQEGTFIEVLQRPTGRGGRPLDTDATEGRFIISSAKFLDAAVYHGGRQITAIGKVVGLKVQQLSEIEYRYPVVEAGELQLWEPGPGPRFSVGVGVGVFHGR